jgi:hypothetical protein
MDDPKSCAVLVPTDRNLLDEAQTIIPCFAWRFITTEAFGSVGIGSIGTKNGFAMLSETEFWLDQKSGPLTRLGEPVLTIDQRQILMTAIDLMHHNRLHGVELVMREMFSGKVSEKTTA